jgi:branched-chain amino acid transport system substrate-binding protein
MDLRPLFISLPLIVVLIFSGCGKADQKTIKIGGIWDLTGPTSDAAGPFSDGERDYIKFINASGGINGKQVELIYDDYAYNIPRAEELYRKLVKDQKVCAILGWGTGDSQILHVKAAIDKVPFIPCSLTEDLSVVSEAPYNFLIAASYSDQIRVALKYILDNWTDKARKPRVAFFYNNTAFGRSPIKAGRDYARNHAIDIVGEQIVSLSALDASDQIKAIMNIGGADYGIINQTSTATATVVRTGRRLNSKIKFITLNWGVDEKVLALTGQTGEGLLGVSPFSFPYEDLPGMTEIRAAMPILGRDINGVGLRYLQGWVTAKVLLAGISRAGQDISGQSVRTAIESLKEFDTGNITSPITFSPECHKGSMAVKIYQIRDGRWEFVTNYDEAVK